MCLGEYRPRVVIMDVGPTQARAFLEKEHPLNRRTPSVAAKYSKAMSIGSWTWTPDGISFSTEGLLINGGNRLRAIINSGVTVKMTVWFDCPTDVFAATDRGAGRSVWQSDTMAGESGSKITYQMGRALSVIDAGSTVVSDEEVRVNARALASAWAECGDVLAGVKISGRGLRVPISLAICIVWLSDPLLALSFADELRQATERVMTPGPAVRNFLRWYENMSGNGSGTIASRDTAWAAASAIRQYDAKQEMSFIRPSLDAWNYWRSKIEAIKALPVAGGLR